LICLGVDPGLSRVGVALGQDSLAIALETFPSAQAIAAVKELALLKKAERIYVGLPLSLSGLQTASTKSAIDFALELASTTTIPIFLLDERLTTSASSKAATNAGKSSRQIKEFIDSEAARLIVESAIASNHKLGLELGDYIARYS
jgi:putative Holliday junction resolvase